jgi:hypothetical protein
MSPSSETPSETFVGGGRIAALADELAVFAASEDEVRRFERHALDLIRERDLLLTTTVVRRDSPEGRWERADPDEPPVSDEAIEAELLGFGETHGRASPFLELDDWFRVCYEDRWRHPHPLELDELEGDGWSLRVELAGTPLESAPFEPVEDDGLAAWVEAGAWHARCGRDRLDDAVVRFLAWSRSRPWAARSAFSSPGSP